MTKKKEIARALTKWKPYAYLRSTEHYDVSDEGETREDWIEEAAEAEAYDERAYLVQINTGGYTGVNVVVLARNEDGALETADEWAATAFYDGDSESMHERGEGPLRVVDLLSVEPNPGRLTPQQAHASQRWLKGEEKRVRGTTNPGRRGSAAAAKKKAAAAKKKAAKRSPKKKAAKRRAKKKGPTRHRKTREEQLSAIRRKIRGG